MKTTLCLLFILSLFACKGSRPKRTGFLRLLQDTTGNRRAKYDLEELEHYNNICKAIGINRLCDGAGRFDLRCWQQVSVFGMAADEQIYSMKVLDSTLTLTFYRVYCASENGSRDPFTEPKIDSFVAASKTFPIEIIADIDQKDWWKLQPESALHLPDRVGFLDGTTRSIELAAPLRYKLIRYHQANALYKETNVAAIKEFIDGYDDLIAFFHAHGIGDDRYPGK
jgi:hypothetical protein